jgi:hypothetical protein
VILLTLFSSAILTFALAPFLCRPPRLPRRHRGCELSISSSCRDEITGFLNADSAAAQRIHRKFTRKRRA